MTNKEIDRLCGRELDKVIAEVIFNIEVSELLYRQKAEKYAFKHSSLMFGVKKPIPYYSTTDLQLVKDETVKRGYGFRIGYNPLIVKYIVKIIPMDSLNIPFFESAHNTEAVAFCRAALKAVEGDNG